ncbi:MAG: 3'-5' exonuclease [Hydrogenophaga sp.]|uniref:3'-5' exonuclease n=1 Tax=Hydrogenophaga sp. TaxID=1904254 RepID=UPI0027226043|nr:3'-5' exonuclease [Hydrogenophaga sp.]MDO9148002.1 3'-5' exonuclease [Hydrogenophaga sp.]MDO9603627.1 3'-5' exonuclease [Hydrogenophaga sp.]MDP2166229.1 3'-5' exonuclease [Hydrogenophaga sp.]MDP3477945.1 3'-5' exonuclease [Hydrogenophaga sp.]
MGWPVLVFDIESIPDIAGLRALRGEPGEAADAQVYAAWLAERKEKGQSDFVPLHLQRVLCISVVFRNSDGLRIHSFVDRDDQSEGKVVQTFFHAVEKHMPQLVSWNGSGFDLPVLHYRGLRHGVEAGKYWDMGEDDREFKWNNYISRYHMRHLDLMDLLAMYSPKNNAPLDAMAKLCGFPGKLGMDGSQVYAQYLAGQTEDIRRYCETDVMNTYLVYCRFQKMRGGLTEAEYEQEIVLVKATLDQLALTESHWDEYLKAWV